MPLLCSQFDILYSGRLKPQWADGLPPRVKGFNHHIWSETLRWSSYRFLSKQQLVHVPPERHTWSQCKWLLLFLFPALNLELGLWVQLIGTWWQRFSFYVLKIGDNCVSSSSFSIQDKAASLSVPGFLRMGQKIFWQSLSGFCPEVQGF